MKKNKLYIVKGPTKSFEPIIIKSRSNESN